MTPPAFEWTNKDTLEHSWKYFSLHAAQRMSVFNFFLILSGGACAGLTAILRGPQYLSWMGSFLGIALMAISFIFWKLDQRTAHLVKLSEQALESLEASLPFDAARIFTSERSRSSSTSGTNFLVRMRTYGQAFRFVFIAMALVGAAGASLCTARLYSYFWWLQ